MHGSAYANIDYSKQYPSRLKTFHNFGLGAAEIAVYPPHSVPQEWPGLGDPQLSKSNPEPWEMRSIERVLTDLGHIDSGLTILKVDVEGAEWDAMSAFLHSSKMQDMISKGKVKQLLLEWHWDPDSRRVAIYFPHNIQLFVNKYYCFSLGLVMGGMMRS
jgi:hypothetical protein